MEVLVQPLQRVLDVQPGANLLEVLRAHGIPVSYSCMAGRCGTCRCRVRASELLDGGAQAQRPGLEDGCVLACQAVLTGPCTIEVPEPDEVVVHPARVLKASVLSIEALTHDILRLRLKPNKPLDFSPGQYAQLQFTPAHVRPYSMAGLPGDAFLEFHLRRVPEGRVTGHVAEALKVGDSVRVSGPMGTAYLRQTHTGPMLCVAGGTGLAPILSIIRGAVQAGMRNPIHLYLGVRTPRDVYGLEELHALRAQHPALQIQVVATTGATADMRSGLVTEAIAADWPDLAGFKAYLCGAPPMVEAASRLLRQRGLEAAQICADAFYSSPD